MGRVVLTILLFACQSHADLGNEWAFPRGSVKLENPECGGILVGSQEVLTLAKCVNAQTRLIWPQKIELQNFVLLHPDQQLAILFFKQPIPTEPIWPIYLIPKESSLIQVKFGNHMKPSEDAQAAVKPNQIKVSNEQDLKGFPMWIVLGPSVKVYLLVGIMLEKGKALRLDAYEKFILDHVQKDRKLSIPAEVVPNKEPVASIEARVAGLVPTALPQELPELPVAPSEGVSQDTPSASKKPPESLGCSCSKIRVRRGGGFSWSRRFFGRL